jgi:hypothetical protein
MHTLIPYRPLAAAFLCALAFSACGSEDPAADGDREDENREAMLAYAGCMRENGVDMPDPQPGQRGIQLRAPKGVTPEEVDEAEQQCRKHLDGIEGPDLTEEEQKEFQEAALAHARCMREQGIDMPDPTFSTDGRAQVRIRRGAGDQGPRPGDPEFEEAAEACRDELPEGIRGRAGTEQGP